MIIRALVLTNDTHTPEFYPLMCFRTVIHRKLCLVRIKAFLNKVL